MGVSVPMEPSASAPVCAMGARMMRSSSSLYPNVCWRRTTEEGEWETCSRSGSCSTWRRPSSSHCW